jgi:uncharacterized protein (UPF0332 family)
MLDYSIIDKSFKNDDTSLGVMFHRYYDCRTPADQVRYTDTTEQLQIYVGEHFTTFGNQLKAAIADPSLRPLVKPVTMPQKPDPNDGTGKAMIDKIEEELTFLEKIGLQEDVKNNRKEEKALESEMRKLYNFVFGRCTTTLQDRIKAHSTYNDLDKASDPLKLLAVIREVVHRIESKAKLPLAIWDTVELILKLRQGPTTSIAQYHSQFKSMMAALQTQGGDISSHPGVAKMIAEQMYTNGTITSQYPHLSADDRSTAMITARDMSNAILFLKLSDPNRFGGLLLSLKDDYAKGDDRFPATVQDAVDLLQSWERNRPMSNKVSMHPKPKQETGRDSSTRDDGGTAHGVTMYTDRTGKGRHDDANDTKSTPNRSIKPSLGKPTAKSTTGTANVTTTESVSHTDSDASHKDFAAFMFINLHEDAIGIALTQPHTIIPNTWVLLDNQSTVDVFCNATLLQNIRQVDETMTIHSNSGATSTNMKGDVLGYGEVWFDPNGIANIISMSNAEAKGFVVTYNTRDGGRFIVANPSTGTTRIFARSPRGLYYSEATAQGCSHPDAGVSFLQTVADNKSKYSAHDYSRAVKARRLQQSIGHPSTADLAIWLDSKLIPHCPLHRQDILNAEDIFGPDEGILQGKTTQKKATQVETTLTPLPPDILERYRAVTLYVDIMYVNRIPFLVTISKHIKFGTVEVLPNRSNKTLLAGLKNVFRLYRQRGFQVTVVEADPEFAPMKDAIAGDDGLRAHLNCCSEDEHVPPIERRIRTIKERVRCIVNTVPFTYWPRTLVTQLVGACVYWLNVFPPKDGLHRTLSPRALVTGADISYTQCQLPFGTYVHTHEKSNNDMRPRTVGAIALRPSGNSQGAVMFLSLRSNRVLTRGPRSYTELPMPDDVIANINEQGAHAGAQPGVYFADCLDDVPYDPTDSFSVLSNDHDLDDDFVSITDSEKGEWITVGPYGGTITGVDDSAVDAADDPVDEDNGGNDIPDALAGNPFAPLADIDEEDDHDYPMNVSRDDDDDESSTNDDANTNASSLENRSVEDESSLNDDDDESSTNEDANTNASSLEDRSVEDANTNVPSLENRSVDGDDGSISIPSLENRSVDADDGSIDNDSATMERGQLEINVDDPSHNPRLQRELYRLSNSSRQVTIMQPSNGNGVCTRSSHGASMTQIQTQECEVTHRGEQKCKPLMINPRTWSEEYGQSLGLSFTQYSMTKGLKLFGDKGIEAVRKEMEQLDKMSVLEPVDPSHLAPSERERVLEYLMFLKEKRCGKIKGRGCADGRPQRLWTDKKDSTSPTAYLESLLLTACIDAKEGRKVATIDIPGAFLHVDQDELVHIRLRGEMARMLGKINPDKYETYIVYERHQPILYAKLNKCLYGTLRAALQFWRRLSQLLKSWGFEANEYDPCVVNKTIQGSQCTILWHVDDLKISHLDSSVIKDVVAKLNEEFGQFAPLTAEYGDVHDYLGMTLDFSEPGKVKIIMKDYIDKVLSELDEFYNGIATTPATNSLFTIRTEAENLGKELSDKFHTITAQLLFLTMRSRPDILTAVAFLTTRVSCPDVDDRYKLRRVIQYLRVTRDLFLTLEPEDLHVYKWWIDASFAVHPNLRSHTGATMSNGKGCLISLSSKQKLNTRSSTEAELVGVDDCMGKILWTKNFMESQGYNVHTTAYQDNESAILLEKNGKASSSKRTRHINIRYFFITDCVQKGNINIEHCPTKDMLGDFFTKPLQGYLFKKLRSLIMNLPPSPESSSMADANTTHDFPSQECVGESENLATGNMTLGHDQGWSLYPTPLLDTIKTI